jgi:hypothetical protein
MATSQKDSSALIFTLLFLIHTHMCNMDNITIQMCNMDTIALQMCNMDTITLQHVTHL